MGLGGGGGEVFQFSVRLSRLFPTHHQEVSECARNEGGREGGREGREGRE